MSTHFNPHKTGCSGILIPIICMKDLRLQEAIEIAVRSYSDGVVYG